jgi:hypothetical protein
VNYQKLIREYIILKTVNTIPPFWVYYQKKKTFLDNI